MMKMGRDWSATQKAQENLTVKRNEEAIQKIAEIFGNDLYHIDQALQAINELNIDDTDTDLMAAIRALGALKARVGRKLYKHTADNSTIPF